MAEGGRGGGKSQAIARLILWLAEARELRVVCGRETQNSIAESVYSIFVDRIREFNLDFTIQASKIMSNKTGTTIHFRGFMERGAFNIQGLEGVDILWVDEAQAITKQTLDVLIPTIRKEHAKIFFSMNRHVPDDPIYVFCFGRDDCLHININFDENPFCTEALKKEAGECQKRSLKDYEHIWMGIPLESLEDALFSEKELLATGINKRAMQPNYGLRLAGFDIARFGDDKCACVGIQQMGALHWEECLSDEWEKKDLNYTTGRILQMHSENAMFRSVLDADGLGAGPCDTLRHGRKLQDVFVEFHNLPYGYKDNPHYGNVRTENAYKLKDMVCKGHMAINSKLLIKELCTLKYTFDHYQRRILVSKKVMKEKFKVKSPNLADAIIMATSQVGHINYEQSRQYYPVPQQAPDCDLYELAGVR